jgi:hypothetical protein
VQDATGKARGYGFEAATSLRFYVDCAVLLGASFDEDPLLFWMRDILVDPYDKDETSKAARAHLHLDNYLVRVYGANGALALPGLQTVANASADILSRVGASPDSLVNWLNSLHPEKCAYVGEPALRLLIAEASDDAAEAGLPLREGTAVLTALKFAYGAGVLVDPLLPRIADGNREDGSDSDRLTNLVRRAQIYSRRALEVVTKMQANSSAL